MLESARRKIHFPVSTFRTEWRCNWVWNNRTQERCTVIFCEQQGSKCLRQLRNSTFLSQFQLITSVLLLMLPKNLLVTHFILQIQYMMMCGQFSFSFCCLSHTVYLIWNKRQMQIETLSYRDELTALPQCILTDIIDIDDLLCKSALTVS